MIGMKSHWRRNGSVLLIIFCSMMAILNAVLPENALKKQKPLLNVVSIFSILSTIRQILRKYQTGQKKPLSITFSLTVLQMESAAFLAMEKAKLMEIILLYQTMAARSMELEKTSITSKTWGSIAYTLIRFSQPVPIISMIHLITSILILVSAQMLISKQWCMRHIV